MKLKKLKKNGEPKKSGGSRPNSGIKKKRPTFMYRKLIDLRIESDFRKRAIELIQELVKSHEEKENNSKGN